MLNLKYAIKYFSHIEIPQSIPPDREVHGKVERELEPVAEGKFFGLHLSYCRHLLQVVPPPESDTFCRYRDKGEKGTVLYIIEAMIFMNEIESEIRHGVVVGAGRKRACGGGGRAALVLDHSRQWLSPVTL